MTLDYHIPSNQTIIEGADGFGLVEVQHLAPVDIEHPEAPRQIIHSQRYRCYPADFSDAEKNKPCVKAWFDAGNPMPAVSPYAATVEPTPAAWVKQVRAELAQLAPYYVSQGTINMYLAYSAEQREAYRMQFFVGGVDRWAVLRDFVLACRSVTGAAPEDWQAWDAQADDGAAHADLIATLATIRSWNV